LEDSASSRNIRTVSGVLFDTNTKSLKSYPPELHASLISLECRDSYADLGTSHPTCHWKCFRDNDKSHTEIPRTQVRSCVRFDYRILVLQALAVDQEALMMGFFALLPHRLND